MAALPQIVVLQSKFNKKNLQFVSQEGDLHGYIQSSGDTVVSPYTKLQIEVSQSDNNLVHVKNCYNNKYWAASSQQDNWIVAGANEPEEDQTKLSCTLFRPTFVDDKTVRLMHVSLGKYLSLKTPVNQNKDVLILCPQSASENQDLSDAFTVFDWSSIIMLPRNLGLKVYKEENYLTASPVDNLNYMKFIADDEWSPAVRQEVSVAGDGYVMVKSVQYGKYWYCDYSSIILANGSNTPSDPFVLFRPESVDGAGANVIGLRNVRDNDYCKRLINENDQKVNNVISAADGTITDLSKLEVIELVTGKLVDNVDFKTLDAKINDTKEGAFDTQEAINTSSQTDETDKVLNFSWKSNSSTWSSIANGSLKVGEKTGISSQIPSVDNGNIIFPSDYKGDIAWGVAQLVTGSEESAKFTVKRLPAKTKVTVKAMGDMNSCEIPFSYTQTNTVNPDGTTDPFEMEDGNYAGVNCSSFKNSYEVEIALLA